MTIAVAQKGERTGSARVAGERRTSSAVANGKVAMERDATRQSFYPRTIREVRGVGPEYAGLLRKAGVLTVAQLAEWQAERLHARLLEVSAAGNIVRRRPTLWQVRLWVAEASRVGSVLWSADDIDKPFAWWNK